MTDQRQSGPGGRKVPRVEIYWTTITYRTVAMYLVIALVLVLAVLYLISPDWVTGNVKKLGEAMGGSSGMDTPAAVNKVRFVALDGKVQVKKVNSVSWVDADPGMTLDKGDLVRTGADGVARISFPEGTSYTVKQDSFVTVEENLTPKNKPSVVGLGIQSGDLDLSTPNWQDPDSSAKVKFEDAEALVKKNSRASVKSDPAGNQHEVTMMRGSAEVVRPDERVTLGQWEKGTFQKGGPIAVSSVIAPPELVEPINLQTFIVADPKKAPIRFEWKPVQNAVAYVVRLSPSSMFSHIVAERRVSLPNAEMAGLNAGDYFWSVTAIDGQNRPSEPSDSSKFTLAAKGAGQEMMLEVEETRLHGNVVEIIGRTEPGAALIINGQAVANIQSDGRFRHFTQPLSPGNQRIVITGQNRRGGTATKPLNIMIPRP